MSVCSIFFFQAEDGIRDLVRSRGLGDVYKRQELIPVSQEVGRVVHGKHLIGPVGDPEADAFSPCEVPLQLQQLIRQPVVVVVDLSLIHI